MSGVDETAEIVAAKRALRAQARAVREQRAAAGPVGTPVAWVAVLMDLAEMRSARTVAAYVSYGTEPATDEAIDALVARGVRVLLPVLLDDRDLDWVDATEPTTSLGLDALADADVVVVPALCVGADGVRLGQGGGSYDRALRRIAPGTPIVALLHEGELVAAEVVPRDDHDIPVTHVATPNGVRGVG